MAKYNLLQAALRYAARGWYVIPLGRGSKEPNFDLLPLRDPSKPKSKTNKAVYAQFGSVAATESQIREWWAKDPGANIGLICGYTSGLVVVDLDPNKRNGPKSYRYSSERRKQLLEREGFEATPLTVKTTSGGWHLYYRHPRAPNPVVTQKGHNKGEGVDVQGGENAYVVAPPSQLRGKRYKWEGDDSAELPAPPLWLINTKTPSETRVHSGYWRSLALSTDIPEGGVDGGPGRNQTLRSLALAKAKRLIPLDEALADLMNWNEARCKPPLTDAAISRQVHHMYKKADQDMGLDGSDRISLRYNGPPFPLGVLRDACPRYYRWVQTLVHDRKAWPDMVAVAGLMGFASAASYYMINIEGMRKWRPPAHLWGTIVADSGSKKSAVFGEIKQALQPTREALAHVADVYNGTLDAERVVLEQAVKSAKAQLMKKPGDPETLERLREASVALRQLPSELPASWTSSNITPEAFKVKMSALGWVGLLSEEGADVLQGFFGHYSGKADLSPVLKSYDLGEDEDDRIGRGRTYVPKSRGSVLILTQPSVLAGLNHTEAEDRGFLARMQFCIPREGHHQHVPVSDADPDEVYKDFADMILGVYFGGDVKGQLRKHYNYSPEFIGISMDFDDTGPVAPQRTGLVKPTLREEIDVHVSAEVWGVISQFQDEMTEQSRSGAVHNSAQSWCKKAGEHALRLAVVMELAESDGKTRELTMVRALASIALMRDYFVYQYYVAIDRMMQPRIAKHAIHLLQRFSEHESFTTSDVVADLRCTTESAAELCRWLADRKSLTVKGRGRNLTCKVLDGVDY